MAELITGGLMRRALLFLVCTCSTALGSQEPITVPSGTTAKAAVLTSPAISIGLDRIDQRSPEPDQKFVRSGTGSGVVVYVFDSGIWPHPQLLDRVIGTWSALGESSPCKTAHGTAVSSAIVGSTLGVAPGAKIFDLRIYDCDLMRSKLAWIQTAVDVVIRDHARRHTPAVANLSMIIDSLAKPDSAEERSVNAIIKTLLESGITVVVSAGNLDWDACKLLPANLPGVITVGAVVNLHYRGDRAWQDTRAPQTAWGQCIDLYAPGVGVLLAGTDKGYIGVGLWSGTSMAAAYVSGAAALYLERHPTATPAEVKAYLKARATLNVVGDSKADTTRLLYVGVEP